LVGRISTEICGKYSNNPGVASPERKRRRCGQAKKDGSPKKEGESSEGWGGGKGWEKGSLEFFEGMLDTWR